MAARLPTRGGDLQKQPQTQQQLIFLSLFSDLLLPLLLFISAASLQVFCFLFFCFRWPVAWPRTAGLWALLGCCCRWRLFGGWGRKDPLAEAGAVGLRRWGTALPVLWSGEMRLFCGAACSRLKERQLGLSAVWVAERGSLVSLPREGRRLQQGTRDPCVAFGFGSQKSQWQGGGQKWRRCCERGLLAGAEGVCGRLKREDEMAKGRRWPLCILCGFFLVFFPKAKGWRPRRKGVAG